MAHRVPVGRGVRLLRRRLRRRLRRDARAPTSATSRCCSPAQRLGARHVAPLPRHDRPAAGLCDRHDVGGRQHRPLRAGTPAHADRRLAVARAMDRSRRPALARRGGGLDRRRSGSAAARVSRHRRGRRDPAGLHAADAAQRGSRSRSAGRCCGRGRWWRALRHRLDDLADLVENLADLAFADDQRRRHRDRSRRRRGT